MKINDIVKLIAHTEHHTRGVIGSIYEIIEIKKTEVKLCSNGTECFYTHANNVEVIRSYDDWHLTTDEVDSFSVKLDKAAGGIIELLKTKNQSYGNTALNPVKIFSKLDATEALCARIDDKIMRIKNKGIIDETEDTVDDLIGYLLLLKMSM